MCASQGAAPAPQQWQQWQQQPGHLAAARGQGAPGPGWQPQGGRQLTLPMLATPQQQPMPMGQPWQAHPGPGTAPWMGSQMPPGAFADDFDDDDDEMLLATIRQVESKVKQEQEEQAQREAQEERLIRERQDQLNLELMLLDVDPNAS